MDSRRDAATTDSLGEPIRAVLPSLERFLEFQGPDPARERSRWRPALDRPLPAAGIGRDATLAELAEPVLSICCFRFRPAGWTDDERLDGLNEKVCSVSAPAGGP